MNLEQLFSKLPDGKDRWPLLDHNLRNGAKGSSPPSVAKLAQDLGFSIGRVPLPRGMSGRLVTDANARRGYRIEVNQYEFIEQQRFAALHELGHGLMHMDEDDYLPNPMYFDPTSLEYDFVSDPKENEANEFVSAINFGNLALKVAIDVQGRPVPKLSRFFGLPRPVVRAAMSNLHVFDK